MTQDANDGDVLGLKSGARGAQMFRRRVDRLFEIIDGAERDARWQGLLKLSDFRMIDAGTYFGLHDDERLIPSGRDLDDRGKPVMWPIDVGTMTEYKDHEESNGFQLNRTRSIDPQKTRGICKIVSRHMLRNDTLLTLRTGNGEGWRYATLSTYHALVGRRWIDVTMKRDWAGEIGSAIPIRKDTYGQRGTDNSFSPNERCGAAIGLAVNQTYLWLVEIGQADGPSFCFETEPARLGSIFKLRDVPEGERRRAALKNWVTSHWRTDTRDPEMEVYVRQHLRGAETFSWDGYFCTIHPSRHDLDLNEELRAERELMGDQAKRQKMLPTEKPRIRVKAISRPLAPEATHEFTAIVAADDSLVA